MSVGGSARAKHRLPMTREATSGPRIGPMERRGTDLLVVERRLVEGAHERAARRTVEGWTVEPVDARRRHRNGAEGPLARRAVAQQQSSGTGAGVLAYDDLVASMPPNLSRAVRGGDGKGRGGGDPPRRLADLDWLQFEKV